MKLIYIGTKITEETHHALRVAAAQEGESVSSILNRLSMDFAKSMSPTPAPRQASTKKARANRAE